MVDVLIVGAGPSGMAAAITLASEGRSVVLLEKSNQAGGQAGTSSLIENFPPFPDGFSGSHFTDAACRQCSKFGVRIEYNTEVRAICPNLDGSFNIFTVGEPYQYQARAVLLALGLDNRHLGVRGEDLPNVHHGMSTTAFECIEREVYAAHVVLVGGGNSVGQAALYYLDKGARVTVAARRPLRETMSNYLLERMVAHTKNLVIVYGEVQSIRKATDGLQLRVAGDFPTRVRGVDCVHIFVGQAPSTDWLKGMLDLDPNGYILTDNQHQTSLPGVFAVGDVVSDAVRRVSCAVGYANEAVPSIHKYLAEKEAA